MKRKKRQYKAREGSHINDRDAQIIGQRLETLPMITRQAVLNDARKPKSPLHRFIEWDSRKAAESWRLQQAQHLITAIRVVVVIDGEEMETVAFHRLTVESSDEDALDDSPVSYYKAVLDLTGEEMREQVLKNALAELMSWRTRYAEFAKVYKKLFGAIDKTIEQMDMGLNGG